MGLGKILISLLNSKHLTYLNLSKFLLITAGGNEIIEESAICIKEFLKKNKTLRKLKLGKIYYEFSLYKDK